MCIIVVKEKGQEMPNNEILENCFERNPDGAGIMYNDKDRVIIKKGFMNVKELEKELEKIEDIKNKGLVIHFRIGTSGTNSAGNTHPYEITKKFWNYKKLDSACDLAVAHNGIISKYTPKGQNKHNFNDTQLYILKRLASLPAGFYKDNKTLEKIGEETNSRFAFLDSKGNITTCGSGWLTDKGIKYSNSSYIKYDFNYSSKYASGFYDDFYYNDFSNTYGWEFNTFTDMAHVLDNMLQVTNKHTIYMENGEELTPDFDDMYFADIEYQELYKLDFNYKMLDYVGNYEIIL